MKNERLFQFDLSRSIDELVQLLSANGHSNTRARRAVLEALAAASSPLNPNQLLEVGRKWHAQLGLVTVYRTLEILQSLGLVRKLHLEDGCHTYVLSTAGMDAAGRDNGHGQGHRAATDVHGHHVICETCGRAVEFEGCDVESVVELVESRTGFKVRNHWLEMFGLCPDCRGAVAMADAGRAVGR